MKATDHPEYLAESNHLQSVIEAVQHRLAQIEEHQPSAASRDREDVFWELRHDFAAHVSAVSERQRIRTYLHALNEPYFLRLDVKVGGETDRQCLYIGKIGLPLREGLSVVDWRAPIAVLRHERTAVATYFAPDGPQEAEIFLNRGFQIRDCSLVEIVDQLDRRAIEQDIGVEPESPAIVDPDLWLRQALEGRAGQKMREIVETIQREQEELVRLPIEYPLIIQGAAGTGKTAIGLHRLAYLLYPGHEYDLSPANILVIAPTQLFIDYISEVLPDLDIRHVRLQTFEDWALYHLLGAAKRNAIQLKSVAPTDDTTRKIKRSLRWLNLASHWFEFVRLRVLTDTQDVELCLDAREQVVPYQFQISASVIGQLLTEKARLPIQTQFTEVLDALRAQIRDTYLARWDQETQARRQAVVHQYEQLAPMREAISRIKEKISEIRKQLRKIDDMSVSNMEFIMYSLRREELRDLQRELRAAQREASSEEIKGLEGMIEPLQAKIQSEKTGQSSSLHALKSEARTLIERKIKRLVRQEEELQIQYRESEDYARYLARIRARNAIDLSTPRQGSQQNFNRALQSLYDQLEAQLNWPDLRAEKQFAEMLLTLSDPKELEHMFSQGCPDGVPCDEVLALHQWANANMDYLRKLGELRTASDENPVALDYDDLAPLLSFQAILTEIDRESLTTRFTLVDEAQDRTPLELWLLDQYSQTGWFTLVGDLAQKLDIRRGIEDWKLLEDVFGPIQYRELRRSYRSTYEITELANSVLAWSKANLPLAEPFERHGQRPKFVEIRSQHKLLETLTAELDRVKRLGILEIGIVCKDHREVSLVYEGLVKAGVSDVSEITDETPTISAGVSVLPIAIAKGLEFPWVIMPNVSAKQFSTIQDCYLLYIGITRALHGISLISVGKFSHYFDDYSV